MSIHFEIINLTTGQPESHAVVRIDTEDRQDSGLTAERDNTRREALEADMEGIMMDLAKRAVGEGLSRSSFSQLAEWAHDTATDEAAAIRAMKGERG